MTNRHHDGSAGDANYGMIGTDYTSYRQPDPEIAAFIAQALGDARSVLNVGAGAGSYEPLEREVTAVEPSASMRAQRPSHLQPAVDAVADRLPFADKSFDASMATFTVHQWPDLRAGLREMRRLTRGPVVVLSCDPSLLDRFWLHVYAPEVIATEARRYPSMQAIREGLGDNGVEVVSVPIPLGCTDGFSEAYYGRPERLLDPGARLPTQPGVLSMLRSVTASWQTLAVISKTVPGTGGMVIFAPKPTLKGHSVSSLVSHDGR